jgi:hypothetical protein
MDGKNTGNDITYLVNFQRNVPSSVSCLFNGDLGLFWASADANGDCNVTGNDVTKLVNFYRNDPTAPNILFCNLYQPLYLIQADVPDPLPEGWPFCENPVVTGNPVLLKTGEK